VCCCSISPALFFVPSLCWLLRSIPPPVGNNGGPSSQRRWRDVRDERRLTERRVRERREPRATSSRAAANPEDKTPPTSGRSGSQIVQPTTTPHHHHQPSSQQQRRNERGQQGATGQQQEGRTHERRGAPRDTANAEWASPDEGRHCPLRRRSAAIHRLRARPEYTSRMPAASVWGMRLVPPRCSPAELGGCVRRIGAFRK
jgi:hypothetical protein